MKKDSQIAEAVADAPSRPKGPGRVHSRARAELRSYAHGRIMEWVEKRELMLASVGLPGVSVTGKEWADRTTRELGKYCDEVLLSAPEKFCDDYPRVALIDTLIRDLRQEMRTVVVLHYVSGLSLAKIDEAMEVEPKRAMHWLWDAQEQIAVAIYDLKQNAERDMRESAVQRIREQQARRAA